MAGPWRVSATTQPSGFRQLETEKGLFAGGGETTHAASVASRACHSTSDSATSAVRISGLDLLALRGQVAQPRRSSAFGVRGIAESPRRA